MCGMAVSITVFVWPEVAGGWMGWRSDRGRRLSATDVYAAWPSRGALDVGGPAPADLWDWVGGWSWVGRRLLVNPVNVGVEVCGWSGVVVSGPPGYFGPMGRRMKSPAFSGFCFQCLPTLSVCGGLRCVLLACLHPVSDFRSISKSVVWRFFIVAGFGVGAISGMRCRFYRIYAERSAPIG